jgi:hypothetical protein
VSKKAVAWVYSLSREQVSPVERDVLLARAQLASENEHLSFVSNGRLATMARTTRLYVIQCNQSLVKKGLMVRATIPRFKTETVWYYLAVNVTNLDIFTSVCQDTRPHPNQVVSLVCASTPYSEKIQNKTKASVASATVVSTILPTAQEKKMPQLRTKKSPLSPLAPTGTGEDVFRLFWDSFPRSWKKRGKDEARDIFSRLGVGMTWFTQRWVPALRHVNYRENGSVREVKFQISPKQFLITKRWTDES